MSKLRLKTYRMPNGKVFEPKPFTNKAEMAEAVNDPRYSSEAAYRNAIEQRLMRTHNNE